MRRFAAILCLLLSATIALAPTSTLHEHVGTDHATALVHGGHLHAEDGHESHRGDHVIDLKVLAATDVAPHIEMAALVVMISSAAALAVLLQLLAPILFPAAPEVRPKPSRRTRWRPPLRGPPLSFI